MLIGMNYRGLSQFESLLLTFLLFAVEKSVKYAKSHEWAKVEGGSATVGISDFAQVQVSIFILPYITWTVWITGCSDEAYHLGQALPWLAEHS